MLRLRPTRKRKTPTSATDYVRTGHRVLPTPAKKDTGSQTAAPAATHVPAVALDEPAGAPVLAGLSQTNSGAEPGDVFLPDLNFNPAPIPSARSELGLHVNQAMKDKIMQGQYIDLAYLNANNHELPTSRISVDSYGQLTLAPPVTRKITSIEDWSDAFLVYASIYLGAHPEKTQAVLKYFSTIRLAAKRHLGTGWKSYDTQFRLRLAACPESMSFEFIDQELWLLFMGPSGSINTGGTKKCYDYNFRSCFRNFCPFWS